MKQHQKKFFSGFFLVCSLFGCKKCISGSENMKMSCNLSNALCKSTERLYTLQLTVNYHGQIKVCANLIGTFFLQPIIKMSTFAAESDMTKGCRNNRLRTYPHNLYTANAAAGMVVKRLVSLLSWFCPAND